ncbi:LysR substrate-binding domain-containing protein [Vibrio lamellibrachiae]|uniref:LysR substrate-binding domain-containing protein n=1 Tax=Vibrio lamellibrachiae TaxID=2910253 RepID=UPI003D0B2CE1
MNKDPLASIELKSLRVLSELLKNHNVTAVASVMAMQPSSVTYHLNKLRDSLSDPLFVQVGRQLTPTQRALSLEPKLAVLFAEVENIVNVELFEPYKIHRNFRIAIQDIGAEVLLPILLNKLSVQAPHITIEVINWPSDVDQQMHDGSIDIAINAIVNLNTQIHGYQLCNVPLSLVTRKNHPLASGNYDISEIFDYPQVRVAPTALGEGRVDQLAEKLGKRRNIVLSASTFSVLSSVVKGSDIVGVFSHGAAQQLGKRDFFYKKIDEIPAIPLHCFWHQRVHHEADHQFIRGLIIEISQEFIKKGAE